MHYLWNEAQRRALTVRTAKKKHLLLDKKPFEIYGRPFWRGYEITFDRSGIPSIESSPGTSYYLSDRNMVILVDTTLPSSVRDQIIAADQTLHSGS